MSLSPEIIAGFAGSVLSARYDDPVPTPACHMDWWAMCCTKHRLVSIAAPRNHAKTTAITHAYLLAALLFREAEFALIVSDTEGQAKDFLNDIIIDLSTNEHLRALFEIGDFAKDTESAIIVNFKDGKQFKVEAKGAGQKVRGIKWNQKRPNLIIIDDLENDENVATREQRMKLKRWINGALIPCMSNTGKLRAAGTIIHSDSWLASTMPDESSSMTIHTPLKVHSKLLSKGWYSAKYRGHPAIGDYSLTLWPDHRPPEFFKEEYERAAADGMTDVYSAEHLNQPIDETFAYFRKNDFKDLPPELPPLNYYGAFDFAISKADRADFTVGGVVGIDEAGNLYLVNVVRGRFDPDESVAEVFRMEREYHPGFILVEKGTLAHAIGAVLNKEMDKKRIYPMLHPIATTGDKRTKARGIQKIARSGHFYVDKSAEWYPAFEDELLRFDRGRNDDQVDMIALFGLKIDEMQDAPTQEEQEEDEWYEEYGQDQPTGRDPTTGY